MKRRWYYTPFRKSDFVGLGRPDSYCKDKQEYVHYINCEREGCPNLIEVEMYFGKFFNKICKHELEWHRQCAKGKDRRYYSPDPKDRTSYSDQLSIEDWFLIGDDPDILRLKKEAEERARMEREEYEMWSSDEFQEELAQKKEELWELHFKETPFEERDGSGIIRCGMFNDEYIPKFSCRSCPHYNKDSEGDGCFYDQGGC